MQEINAKVDYRDIAIRSIKTFVQAFVAVLLVADEPFKTEVLIAGVGAGVSAVWNFVKATL